MKISRFLLVLFAVLGMAGVATSAVSPGFSDDFESYSLGTLQGQGPWVDGLNGSGPAEESYDVDIVAEGVGSGPQAFGHSSDSRYHGAGLEITGADSGVIDISFLSFESGRKHLFLEGDGAQGNATNYIFFTMYRHWALPAPNDYAYIQWSVVGWVNTPEQVKTSWLATDGEGGPLLYEKILLPPNDPQEFNIRLDFDNDLLLVRYRDVDDTTGEPTGEPWVDIIPLSYAIPLPFNSLTWFELARNWGPSISDWPTEVNYSKGYMDNFSISSALIPGDFDGDGDVDGADFGLWQSGYPTASGATLGDGDADGDGDVDGADFGIWQANYPTNVGSAATIPEPATLVVLLAGSLALLETRKRRSS